MKKLWPVSLSIFLLILCVSSMAFASDGDIAKLDSGDTAWVLISAALVFIMTPGLGFFYGGMVRSKNVLTTIMHSFFIVGIISVEWVLIGYTMVFGDDATSILPGIIGSFDKVGLIGTAGQIWTGTSIPELAFVIFQCMFAVITPALITGAFAERVKFKSYVLFMLLWTIFVYNPMAHMVWGGGKLFALGALDFAGGLVIHILSGVSGLTLCILLGKRHGYGKTAILPHHLPMTVLGAALLWFGWFGFNAGSALGANELAANAFVATQVAAAMAAVSWVVCEWLKNGKPTTLGAASGCVAGLVAITPAAGFVAPLPALCIGLLAGIICYFAVAVMKTKLGYDDSLDAFGVHGIGGTWGALAAGIWATTVVNPAGANGLYFGEGSLFTAQVISIIVAYLLGSIGTYIIYKIVNGITGFRVTKIEEISGLDITEHGERAYGQSLTTGETLGMGKDFPDIK